MLTKYSIDANIKKLTLENPNINDIDEIFYAYILEHDKKYDYYLMKCEFELILKDN